MRPKPGDAFQPTWLAGASRDASSHFDYDAFRANWYNLALSINPGTTLRDLRQDPSLMGLHDTQALVDLLRPTQDDVTRLCREYLGMLAWSFHYYVRGAQLPRVPPEVLDEGGKRGKAEEIEEVIEAPETLLSLAAFIPTFTRLSTRTWQLSRQRRLPTIIGIWRGGPEVTRRLTVACWSQSSCCLQFFRQAAAPSAGRCPIPPPSCLPVADAPASDRRGCLGRATAGGCAGGGAS